MLHDKVVIVTGAGGGLGQGIAAVCSRYGAKVVVADIRGDAAKAVSDSLPGESLSVECDVANDAALDDLVARTLAAFGRIDGLVNNAGVNFAKPFFETTPADWDRVISVDLRAVFFLSQKVSKQMLKQDPPGGSIVNIASVHAQSAVAGCGPYDAAKGGVVAMGKTLALDLAPHIRVNAISPGLCDTNIWQNMQAAVKNPQEVWDHWKANIPLARTIQPEEIGNLAAFLLSPLSSCVTGTNMFADCGMTAQLVSKEQFESTPIDGSA